MNTYRPLAEAETMVDQQLIARGIRDERVLDAMRRVPRHRFVPRVTVAEAYADKALPTAAGQTISQPYMVALMTSLLAVEPGHKVLEIGTGSGYQTAVLAMIGADVVTMEVYASLTHFARKMIDDIGLTDRVTFVEGDGTLGCQPHAPFDRILVTAGAPHVPKRLKEQLTDDGRIVIPLGDRASQTLTVVTRRDGEWQTEASVPCRFVPLVGEDGWADEG